MNTTLQALSALDRRNARMEHERDNERDTREYEDLSPHEQRHLIQQHMQLHPGDIGLFGESITESRYRQDILDGFYADDTTLNDLVDSAFREYIGKARKEELEELL